MNKVSRTVPEAAAAAMTEVKSIAIAGGKLDLVKPDELQSPLQPQEPRLTIGRHFIRSNAWAYEQWFTLAQRQGDTIAERPAFAMIGLRAIEGATYLILRPCREGEAGVKVSYEKKNPRSFHVARLHQFLKRHNLIPPQGTVFTLPCFPGHDADLGPCILARVSEAKQRPVEKRENGAAE